jgi:hypothetical protein
MSPKMGAKASYFPENEAEGVTLVLRHGLIDRKL